MYQAKSNEYIESMIRQLKSEQVIIKYYKNNYNINLTITDIKDYINKFTHLITDTNNIDTEKAKTIDDVLFIEIFTKNPRKQNTDEKDQISKLKKCFNGFEKLIPNSLFLENGKTTSKPNNNNPKDLDATISNNNNIVFSLKRQKGHGGTQNMSFENLVETIHNAPTKGSEQYLIVYVEGDFYTDIIKKKYKNYPIAPNSNKIDILKNLSRTKNVLVITECDLPKRKVNIMRFIKNYENKK